MNVWVSIANLQAWEWIGVLIARAAVGVLFAISGGGKLMVPNRRERMRQTMREAGLPAPRLLATIISTIEFTFGSCLVVGLLTPLACLMLSGAMIGALTTTVLPHVRAATFVDWLGEVLYLPEVLYLVILVWLFFSGPGWLSVDRLLLP
jgi:putative oxidoreductase